MLERVFRGDGGRGGAGGVGGGGGALEGGLRGERGGRGGGRGRQASHADALAEAQRLAEPRRLEATYGGGGLERFGSSGAEISRGAFVGGGQRRDLHRLPPLPPGLGDALRFQIQRAPRLQIRPGWRFQVSGLLGPPRAGHLRHHRRRRFSTAAGRNLAGFELASVHIRDACTCANARFLDTRPCEGCSNRVVEPRCLVKP
eukprot:1675861-Pyramimonas_sp.AAC.1